MMLPVERKLIEWIERYRWGFCLAAVSVLGVVIRFMGMDYETHDYIYAFHVWCQQMKELGLPAAITTPIGDYNVLYQTVLALIAQLPFKDLYAIKAVTILFDYLLAGMVALITYDLTGKSRARAAMAYAASVLLPTGFFISSWWAQCDAIYAAFCLLCLWLMMRKKYAWSCLTFGVAFAWKLQAIFILPFLIYSYFNEKKFSVCWFALAGVPIVVLSKLCGRGFLGALYIYFDQTGMFQQQMYMSYPGFYVLLPNDYSMFHTVAMALTVSLLGLGLVLTMHRRELMAQPGASWRMLIWTVWTAVMFLPGMHERYGYLLDFMLIAAVMADLRLAPFFAAMQLVNLGADSVYLFHYTVLPMQTLGYINLAAYCTFTFVVFALPVIRQRKATRIAG